MYRLQIIALALLLNSSILYAGKSSLLNTVIPKLRQHVGMAMLSTSLFLAPLPVIAQQADVRQDRDFRQVTARAPDYHQAAFLLHINFKEEFVIHEAVGEEGLVQERDVVEVWDIGFHTAFIGRDPQGNSLLVSRRRPASDDILLYLAQPTATVSLHGWDGEVDNKVEVTVVGTFKDKTDGVFDTVILAVDTDLAKDYPSMQVTEFPFHDQEDVELLTYKPASYFAHLNPLELNALAAEDLPLYSRECVTAPNAVQAAIGLGSTTCGGALGEYAGVGSLIVNLDGELVGFLSYGTPDNKLWWTSDTNYGMRQAAARLTRGASPVNAAGKVPTIWGEIKQNY